MTQIEVFEEFGVKLQYEWDKVVGYQRASDEFWQCAEAPKILATQMAHWLFDSTDIRLTWPVAQRKMLDFQWPCDWWQAFKMRWFPLWARQRWPIRYQRIELRELLACRKESEWVTRPLAYSISERQEVDGGG